MTDELPGYDDWKLRSDIDQDELDRAWARRGRRERDPDRDRDAERDREYCFYCCTCEASMCLHPRQHCAICMGERDA